MTGWWDYSSKMLVFTQREVGQQGEQERPNLRASPLASPVISIIPLTSGYRDVLIYMYFPIRTSFKKEITYSIQQLGRTQGDNAYKMHLRWLANNVRYSFHKLYMKYLPLIELLLGGFVGHALIPKTLICFPCRCQGPPSISLLT